VLENGKPREIASFEAVEVADGRGPAEAALALPARESAPHVLQPAEGRALLVYFDDFHVQDENAEPVRRGLTMLLSRELRPGDALTIVAPQQGLWWTARTPYEQAQLPRVIERLRGQYNPDPFRDRTSDWARSVDYGKELVGAMQTMAARSNQEVTLWSIRRTLTGLERAIESLASFRGRKSLVVFSEGFILSPELRGYARVIDLCRRANVAISVADPGGLRTGGAVASAADSSSNASGAGAGATTRIEGERAGASQLALATGGRIFASNDLTEAVERVLEESKSYYLIGFEPAEGRAGERKLELRVRGRHLTVRARSRYVVGATRDPFDDPAAIRATRELSDRADVPFRVSTAPGDEPGAVELDITLEPVEPPRERRIELLVERRPLAGGEVVRDTAALTLPPSHGDQNVAHHLRLAPGVWQLRVVVTDVGEAAIGSALHTFEVPSAATP
jgi:VWFA-related protein